MTSASNKFQYLVPGPGRTAANTLLLAHPRTADERRPIVWSITNKHYYIFETLDELAAWIISKPAKERTFCEVIFGDEPQRLKLDYDDVPLEALKPICEHIKRLITKPAEGTNRLYIFQTSEKSFHILIDHFVPNVKGAQDFARALSEAFPEAKPDMKIYHSIQNFRLIGCSKGDLQVKQPINVKSLAMADAMVVRYYKKSSVAPVKDNVVALEALKDTSAGKLGGSGNEGQAGLVAGELKDN